MYIENGRMNFISAYVRAAGVASVIVVLVWTLIIALTGAWEGFVVAMFFGAILAGYVYLFTLLLGVPIHLLLRRLRQADRRRYATAGALLGPVPAWILLSGTRDWLWFGGVCILFAVAGGAAGWTFSVLRRGA